MSTELGFVTIRNEDGTQWWSTHGMWGPKSFRRAMIRTEFERIQAYAPETTKNNSPDNGYYGLMNLKFHPCTAEEAIAADDVATKLEDEEAAQYDEFE